MLIYRRVELDFDFDIELVRGVEFQSLILRIFNGVLCGKVGFVAWIWAWAFLRDF